MTTSGQIQRSIQRFQEFASDLIRSDDDTFGDRLAVFMHFCQTDPFFSQIDRQLGDLAVDQFDSWLQEREATLQSMSGSGELTFPVDLELRVAMQFELLRRINAGAISFLHFTHTFFSPGNRISDHIRALNEAVTKSMARELKHRLEDVLEQLPEDKRSEVGPAIYQVFHNVHSVVQQQATGSNIQQAVTVEITNDLKKAFSDLRVAVASAERDPELLCQHNEVISAAETLASEKKPKHSAIKTLLNTLPAITAVAELVKSILDLAH